MTPKEQAEQIYEKFFYSIPSFSDEGQLEHNLSKQCALIAVDETIRTLNEDIRDLDVRGNVLLDLIEYWREVKQEIKKL